METKSLWADWPEMPTETKWIAIREYRKSMISACDWTKLADAILTNAERTAWQDYRQALRDIPQDFANPDDVIFPDPPTGV